MRTFLCAHASRSAAVCVQPPGSAVGVTACRQWRIHGYPAPEHHLAYRHPAVWHCPPPTKHTASGTWTIHMCGNSVDLVSEKDITHLTIKINVESNIIKIFISLSSPLAFQIMFNRFKKWTKIYREVQTIIKQNYVSTRWTEILVEYSRSV